MGSEPLPEDFTRLGRRVRERRENKGMTIVEAATAAGMSHVTWGRVEKGERVRPLTYTAIDRALGWVAGSCRAVLGGGEPILTVTTEAQAPLSPAEIKDLLAQLDRIKGLDPLDRAHMRAKILEAGKRSSGESPERGEAG